MRYVLLGAKASSLSFRCPLPVPASLVVRSMGPGTLHSCTLPSCWTTVKMALVSDGSESRRGRRHRCQRVGEQPSIVSVPARQGREGLSQLGRPALRMGAGVGSWSTLRPSCDGGHAEHAPSSCRLEDIRTVRSPRPGCHWRPSIPMNMPRAGCETYDTTRY